MKSQNFLALAAFSITLTGCASSPVSQLKPFEYIKPAVGETQTASMGDPLLKSTTGVSGDALELGSAKGSLSTISAGTYCHDSGNVYRNYTNERAVGLANIYGHVVNFSDYVTYDAANNTISPPNRTTYTESEISIKRVPQGVCALSNAPVKSIEYSGNGGGVLKFTYREVSVTRGETATDFTVPEKDSDIVTYKGARFKVLSTDHSSIKYTVLSGFTKLDKPY